MVNIQTVMNLALMVVVIIMGAVIVMQHEQTCPVVEQPVCPTVTPIVTTVYTESPYCKNVTYKDAFDTCDQELRKCKNDVTITSPEEIARRLGETPTVPDSTYDGRIPEFTSVTMTQNYNANYMVNKIPAGV